MSGLSHVLASPHPDFAPIPEDPGVLRGIPYRDTPGGRPLELDLWRPEGTDPLPLLVFVHGGGWRRGRRDDMGLRMREWTPGPFARLAAAGFAVASVDYRLSGEAVFPAALDDVRAAVRWLSLRARELRIDPDRLVVWGESAGGHLASLLALTEPAVRGAVIWYGPSDLQTPREGFDPAAPHTPEALLLGAAPAAVPGLAREASPIDHVHEDAPPFLLMHGLRDSMVPYGHSEDLAAALPRAELRLVPDADHVWYGLPDEQVAQIFLDSLDFALSHAG
ncbi:alpha/beta hydrolase [Amycolatopsis acidicola]|uniref:alpha/beta hydrolase n=1 Tax=Amycolatopsis acidicola TaxID=2596893 RepID=UPI001AA06A6C|nr:alpha/beta hydrolase [Amycolatopsis acidicola]